MSTELTSGKLAKAASKAIGMLLAGALLCPQVTLAAPGPPHWMDDQTWYQPFDSGRKDGGQSGTIRLAPPSGYKVCNFNRHVSSMRPNHAEDPEYVRFELEGNSAVLVIYNLGLGAALFPGSTWINGGVMMDVVPRGESC